MTGEQFKVWRKRLGYTQHEAALRLELTRRTIQNYEAGDTDVPRAVALAAAALELGLDEYDGEPLALRAGPLTVKGVV